MYHNYAYEIWVREANGFKHPYTGTLTNLRSEQEAMAVLKRMYPNMVDCNVWQV